MALSTTPLSRWKRPELWVALLTLSIVGLCTWSQLPRGVCFGDSGGLQLASATLGITHPPGYVVYTSLGFLVSTILPFEPAFTVTICSWLMSLGAFVSIVIYQTRWEASGWLGGAVTLALLMVTNVRQNYLAPEVYGPTLFLLALGVLFWAQFLRQNQMRLACAAGLMFGIACVSRPPTVLILPFVWLSYRLARGRFWPNRLQSWRRAAALTAIVLAPFLYSFVYLLVRDSPRTTYNYLANQEVGNDEFPARSAGVGARVQRVLWHATARQFRAGFHATFWGTVSKLRWVSNRLLPNQRALFAVILLIASLGVIAVWRIDRILTVLVLGMGFSSLMFVCFYRVYDLAADLLPFIFAVGAFAGVGLHTLIQKLGTGWSQRVSIALFAAMLLTTIGHGVVQRRNNTSADALPFVSQADVESLPTGSVVMTGWYHATPLWYAQHVMLERNDLAILCLDRSRWGEFAERYANSPIFVVEPPGEEDPFDGVQHGSLWMWKRRAP